MATDPDSEGTVPMFGDEEIIPLETLLAQRHSELLKRWKKAYARELYMMPPIRACNSGEVGPEKAKDGCKRYAQLDINRADVAAQCAGLVLLSQEELKRLLGLVLAPNMPQLTGNPDLAFLWRLKALCTPRTPNIGEEGLEPPARAPP